MVDRVQPLKLEDSSTGGTELDQYPTSLDPKQDHVECAGLVLDDADNRDENVRIWRIGNHLNFKDVVNSTPRTLSELLDAVTEGEHEALATLVHDIDATSYDELIYDGSRLVSVITWTSSLRTRKVREESYTYVNNRVEESTTIQYDLAGVEKMRVTEVYTYLNGRVISVQRTKVVP